MGENLKFSWFFDILLPLTNRNSKGAEKEGETEGKEEEAEGRGGEGGERGEGGEGGERGEGGAAEGGGEFCGLSRFRRRFLAKKMTFFKNRGASWILLPWLKKFQRRFLTKKMTFSDVRGGIKE